jgi:hypothetical protein
MDMYGDVKFTVLINFDEAKPFAPDPDPFPVLEGVGMLR